MFVVGLRGADVSDPRFRADIEMCKAAHIRAVILFDVDAQARDCRNIVSPAQTRDLTDAIRAALGADCLIMVDQEGGAVARLRPDLGFALAPAAREYAGLAQDDRLQAARALANCVREAGCNVNCAPCVDIASCEENRVVVQTGRCLSSDAAAVATLAQEVTAAHREAGVRSCIKHFPGHGCSREDSHSELPDITDVFCTARDLAPYRDLFAAPADRRPDMVMTGHLIDRRVDPVFPASLSAAHTTGALREALGWEDVVVTDSIDMGAIAQRWSAQEAAIHAINAGADLVMHAWNPAPAGASHPAGTLCAATRAAIREGQISGGADRLAASAVRTDAIRRRP